MSRWSWIIRVGAWAGERMEIDFGSSSCLITLPDRRSREMQFDGERIDYCDDDACLSFWKSERAKEPRIFYIEEVLEAEQHVAESETGSNDLVWLAQHGGARYRMLGAQLDGVGPIPGLPTGDPGRTPDVWLGINWYVMYKKGDQPYPPSDVGIVFIRKDMEDYGIYYTRGPGEPSIRYDELSFNRPNFTMDSAARSVAYWQRAQGRKNVIFAMYNVLNGGANNLPFESLPSSEHEGQHPPTDDPIGVWGAEEG